MKVLAGVVLYNPDISRLKQNLNAIANQVDELICVDNGSSNIEIVKHTAFNKEITILELGENLGIAAALNRILQYAKENGYDWFITLDQDSVCMPNLISNYKEHLYVNRPGILACSIQDRNFSISSKKIEDIEEIEECITSASFCNTAALSEIGGFDEKLFIDSVDFDVCLNLRKHGYKIYKTGFVGILHEVGHGKNVKLLWKKRVVYNHSALRNYYMARNHIYMAKKYSRDISMIKTILKELESEILILLYENGKLKKIGARYRGVVDGFINRMGVCKWY